MPSSTLTSAAKIKKKANTYTRTSFSRLKGRPKKTLNSNTDLRVLEPPKNIFSNSKIKKKANRRSLTCGMYFRQVPPTRVTQGKDHRISGTIIQVLGELDTAGIRPLDIFYYSDDGTNAVCVYRRGR